MYSILNLSVIVSIFLSSSIGYAAPSPISNGRSFRMDLERRPIIPASINNNQKSSGALAAESGVELDLQSVYVDVEYVGTIGVGSPPTEFKMVLDTGSSDIWFPSSACDSCGDHPLFDSEESSTYKSLNRKWSLGYFDGSYVRGVVGTDTVYIGELSHKNQIIGLATSESNSFAGNAYLDGVFGLGFPSLSLTRQKSSIVMDMYNAGEIEEPIVGMHLGRTRDGGKGEATFGGVNTDLFTGDLSYIDVTKKGYWQVDFGGVEIDGELYTDDTIDQAMIDTGTTLLDLPNSLADLIHKTIPNGKYIDSLGWFFPCNTTETTTVTFRLGGQEFPLTLSELIRDRYLIQDPSYCITGVGYADQGIAIMGETFLRNYYSSYNVKDAKVGFAPSGK